jgi:hypothetical protein
MSLKKAGGTKPEVGDLLLFMGSAESLDKKYKQGWRVADGTDGTANLIDQFPKMGTFAQKGAAGGVKTVTPSGSVSVAVSNHTLSEAQMPSHLHRIPSVGVNAGGSAGFVYGLGNNGYSLRSVNGAGSSGAHAHGAGGSFSGASQTNEPQHMVTVPLYFTGVSGSYL